MTTIPGTKTCQFCGEEIKGTAEKCRYCGEFVDGRAMRINILSINWGPLLIPLWIALVLAALFFVWPRIVRSDSCVTGNMDQRVKLMVCRHGAQRCIPSSLNLSAQDKRRLSASPLRFHPTFQPIHHQQVIFSGVISGFMPTVATISFFHPLPMAAASFLLPARIICVSCIPTVHR